MKGGNLGIGIQGNWESGGVGCGNCEDFEDGLCVHAQ